MVWYAYNDTFTDTDMPTGFPKLYCLDSLKQISAETLKISNETLTKSPFSAPVDIAGLTSQLFQKARNINGFFGTEQYIPIHAETVLFKFRF